MNKKEYYLGLDMGTSSVGWAVTDKGYNLLRAKGKDLWGIREFDEAKTAAERRSHRISRRRRQREQVRIGLLRTYFDEAIQAVDPLFFQRLENSKYHLEDKDEVVRVKNGIFNEENYTDKEYYQQYPTIFHLRKELITNEMSQEHDVRLVYLALENMFKHRGHFLNASISSEENGTNGTRKLEEVYMEFIEQITLATDITFMQNIDLLKVEEILSSRDYSRTKKSEEICGIMGIDLKDRKKTPFIKAICGRKIKVQELFENLQLPEGMKGEICFADNDYEEKRQEISEILVEEQLRLLDLTKEIYDIGLLAGIMKGYSYLSESRVAEYKKHKEDLVILKRVIKKYNTMSDYNELFRTEMDGSYSAYVGSYNSGKKLRRTMKARKKEDLYKTVKKMLKGAPAGEKDVEYILQEIEKESFLPKQLTSANGVIPNQVHAREMKKILNNAENYLPFLKEVDDSGLTISEKILSLFSFQIPYYIGPTSEKSKENGGNGWVVRTEGGQILPWNINQKIDIKATAEEFINRMIRCCTYISDERALPKASLEYEAYCVLNEINNIKVNGEKISVELKQEIYTKLFKKGKRVTRSQIEKYLLANGIIESEEQLSGIDITVNSSLATYGKFKAIFGEEIDNDSTKRMVEDIVFWCTVYGESRELIKERLEEKYGKILSSEQIKRIMGYKFKDWGRLSKEFLELQGCDKSDGESKSLIRMMWDTNHNMMELINDARYTFKDAIEDKQREAIKCLYDFTADDLEEYYFSAPVRRMIWQTILIIKELIQIMGQPPKKIFVEMTRKSEDIKNRTISRKQKFLDLYKKVKDEEQDWKKVIESADSSGTMKSKKMYLYLTQMGRCMYTGKRIDLENLFNDNLYDIDHIYPRHFVKDDNIDNNLVLVEQHTNRNKSDIYPLDESICKSQKAMWKELYTLGFISEEKYNRLTSRKKFTEEEQAGFIARQLVETSQGAKGVTEVLKQLLPDTTFVYSKASNVSDFRRNRELPKSRLLNEFHHAHDAYLNIVVGNVYFTKFTQNPLNFIRNEYAKDKIKNNYNLSKMFDYDVVRNGEIAWIAQKDDNESGTIVTVKEMLRKNTPLMTRYSYEGHGALADETLYGKGKAKDEVYIPFKETDVKMRDVKKYGGFSSVSIAYFFVVDHEMKDKRVRTIEALPIYMKDKIHNKADLRKYCEDKLNLTKPDIKIAKIKIQSLVKINGYFAYITGKTGKQIILRNAVNLCLKDKWTNYIKKLEKYEQTGIIDDLISEEDNISLYKELMNKFVSGIYKNRPNPIGEKLKDRYSIMCQLKIESQCKIILQLLRMTSIGGNDGDLSLIEEPPHCGKMLISKNITDVKEMYMINHSVTGVYEKKEMISLHTV